MSTELIRFTQWAKDQPQKRFTALMGLLAAEEGLTESYHRQPSRKAAGVDGIDKANYGRELTESPRLLRRAPGLGQAAMARPDC